MKNIIEPILNKDGLLLFCMIVKNILYFYIKKYLVLFSLTKKGLEKTF